MGTLAIKHPMKVDVPMCEVFEVEDGKIVNSRNYFDAKLVSGFGEN